MTVSYFEIGGELITLELGDVTTENSVYVSERSLNKKQLGITRQLAGPVKGGSLQGYDVEQAIRGGQRTSRAVRAFSTAATLAVADGPLPFGDTLAVGLLVAYGMYEGHRAFVDLRQ
jgi:hypothetical protein